MTGNEMLSTLGLRLEDPQESSFTQSAKLDALNIAQKSVVNLVHNAYLGELETIANNKVAGAGTRWSTCEYSVAFGSDLPIRNGITAIFDETNDKWCTMIEPGDVKRLENTYLAGSAANPIAFAFNETIYVQPASCELIDVWYLKAPADIAADGVECELNVAMHESVVDLAESQLWKMDAKVDRAGSAFGNAKAQIDALNARYPAEAPSGIGTKGRG
jgi:hypothetical protein|tara:strand:- start:865 stop:1515 length:651 start_codon:yes stop_codon:yes gene_type:complete